MTRLRWNSKNQKNYLQTTCRTCERAETKQHQKENREYWRALNKKAYQNWTLEVKEKRLILSNLRHKRLNSVPWDNELTELVTIEAHELRKLRNKITGFKWHVDHIIPLNGSNVSGLHVWNNLQVIPATVNLSKGNRVKGDISFHT